MQRVNKELTLVAVLQDSRCVKLYFGCFSVVFLSTSCVICVSRRVVSVCTYVFDTVRYSIMCNAASWRQLMNRKCGNDNKK